MYHSITIGDKNTWDDWHLIPTSRPLIEPPDVKTSYLDIPGSNGSIDLTEAITGYPTFENRSGSWEFIVVNGYDPWQVAYSNILNYLHGKNLKVVLEDDKDFYYEGRLAVNKWKSDKSWSIITIDYNVYPYKKEINGSMGDWLWDPFNFYTGIIRNYKNLKVEGSLSVMVPGRKEYVVPIITVSSTDGSGMDVTFENKKYHLNDGENVNPNINIGEGDHTLLFEGNGTITIDYRGGEF